MYCRLSCHSEDVVDCFWKKATESELALWFSYSAPRGWEWSMGSKSSWQEWTEEDVGAWEIQDYERNGASFRVGRFLALEGGILRTRWADLVRGMDLLDANWYLNCRQSKRHHRFALSYVLRRHVQCYWLLQKEWRARPEREIKESCRMPVSQW
jgi:hypothetical protein